MASGHYGLSDAAFRALNDLLLDPDFRTSAPSLWLDDVLDYLYLLEIPTEAEGALKSELEDMPDATRKFLSRAIAAARRTG